ncbi:hypothetical protein [Spirosoma pomorum]
MASPSNTIHLFRKICAGLFLLLLLVTVDSRAQTFPLQIQVSVMPPYSAYLQDYPGTGQQVRVFLINTSRQTYQVRLAGQLTGDNGIEIRTSPNYRPPRPLTVPPGQTLLTRNDLEGLFDLNQIEVIGINKNLLARGFPLPDGTYQLCVRAYNETAANATGVTFGQALSAEFPLGCSAPIVVRSVEPPILISPLCDAEVTATTPQAVVFTWTPPAGVSPAQVDYTLRIVELPQADVDPNVFIDAIALPKSGVEVRGLRTSTFLYGPTQPPLQLGKRYAWRVQAIDRSRRINFLNDGKSPVCVFTYGAGLPPLAKTPGLELVQTPIKIIHIPGLNPGEDTPPAGATAVASKYTPYKQTLGVKCSCFVEVPDNQPVDNTKVLTSKTATIAGFQLSLLDNVKESEGGVLNGDGMIPIPIVNSSFAKLRVHLYDVQCNAAGQVISGIVRARLSDSPGAASLMPGYDKPNYSPPTLTSDQISKFSEFFSTQQDQLVSALKNSANSAGFGVPFGIDKAIGPVQTVIAITDVTFTPENAYFNANTWIKAPGEPGGFNGIPLSGYNLCLSPDKPCGDGILYLASEMKLTNYLSLKGLDAAPPAGPFTLPDTTQITYALFDQNGYRQMRVHAALKPPKLLDVATNSQLAISLNFGMTGADFTDWTAQVFFPEFYVQGLKDITFAMQPGKPALYDHSETATPGKLPVNYDGYQPGEENLWKGLFFPEIQVKLGGFFSKLSQSGTTLTGGVQNLIYDDNGLTGKAYLTHLLGLGDGNLASWYASIDTVAIDFLKSDFQSSRMNGQVVLPIFKYKENMDESAVWPWTCTLKKDEKGGDMAYQFLISPKQDAAVEVWQATLALNKDLTYISVGNKSGKFVAEAVLDGKVSINTGTFISPGMTFKGLTLTSEDPYIKLDGFTTSFASPQKDLAGMPFTLTDVNLKKALAPAPLGQFDFSFTGGLELAEAASLTATATTRLRFSAGLSGGRPDWKYVDTYVDKVTGDGHIGPLTAKVDLDFYHDNAKYGNGFSGVATLGLGFVGGLAVKAKFGKTIGNDSYRYWYVGGTAVLPAGGVPIGTTPVAFKGFGGGAFSRMTQVTDKQGQIDYEPSSSTKFGLQAKVILGTTGSNLLNVDAGLTMAFSDNMSPSLIGIHGDAYLLANDPPNYGSALAKGTVDITYDIAHDVFDTKGGLTASYGVEGFKVEAVAREVGLRIKPSEGKWFFSLGVPNDRLDLNIYVASKDPLFTFGSYLLTGNDIPNNLGNLPPDPYKLSAKTKNDLHYKPQDITPLIAGKTPLLAFGAGYHVGNEYKVGPFFLDFKGDMGYDLVLYNTDQACGGTLPGINGWYATGQLYAYLYFALGIDVDLWVYSGRIKAVELEAGALLQGGLVNPIWFHGNVFLRYSVLHGAVKGKMNMDFWYNKDGQCKPAYTPPNPFADQPLISRVAPSTAGDEQVSTLTPFYAEFNYPINSEMTVDAVTPEGKTLHRRFDIRFKKGESFEAGLVRKSGPGGYDQCINDPTGKIKYGQEGSEEEGETYTATFYRTWAMTPFSQYDLNLGVEVWHEYTPDDNDPDYKSGWHPYRYKKSPVEQSVTASFKTGACLTGLTREGGESATVLFSYPFEGQRYFTRKDGSGFGVIMLSAKMCCMNNLASDKYFSLQVRMTPYQNGTINPTKAGGALYADATFKDNNRAQYNLPLGIQANTLYALDLVRVPTQAYIDEQEALAKSLKQKAVSASSLSKNKFLNSLSVGPNQSVGTATSSSASGPMVNAQTSVQPVGVATPGAGLGNFALSVNQKAATLTEEEYLKQLTATGTRSVKYNERLSDLKQFSISYKQPDDPESLSQKYEQILYSYYFKTSRFDRMEDKLKAVTMLATNQKIYPVMRNGYSQDNAYGIGFQSPEPFDTFELEPQPVPNGSIMIQPLVNFRDNSYNDWVSNFMIPMFGALIPMGLDSKALKSVYEAKDYLLMYNRTDFAAPEPPLSSKKIKAILKNANHQ